MQNDDDGSVNTGEATSNNDKRDCVPAEGIIGDEVNASIGASHGNSDSNNNNNSNSNNVGGGRGDEETIVLLSEESLVVEPEAQPVSTQPALSPRPSAWRSQWLRHFWAVVPTQLSVKPPS